MVFHDLALGGRASTRFLHHLHVLLGNGLARYQLHAHVLGLHLLSELVRIYTVPAVHLVLELL